MTTFEEVMKMKAQGKAEGEIIATLRANGTNPMEISDALNQSQIKEAVYDTNPTAGMMPSIMQSESGETAPAPTEATPAQQQVPLQEMYAPEPSNIPQAPQGYPAAPTTAPAAQQQTYTPETQQQAYAPEPSYSQNPTFGQKYDQAMPPQDQYAGDQYDQGEYYDSDYQNSTDTMIEVAEQVFAEKMKKLSKELKDLYEFKTIFQQKVENLSNRLERMEKNFDKMQLQILDKVGEYGKGLNHIRKELNMVEDTVGKFAGKK